MDLGLRNARISLSPSCNMHCSYCDGSNARQQLGAMEDFRSTPLCTGIITTTVYKKIISVLGEIGISGVSFTGGEPFLNKDLAEISDHAKDVGITNINVTTNGLLLERFLDANGKLPDSLSLMNVSLDTFDPEVFKNVTRTGNLASILSALKRVAKANPNLPLRANKVGLRSTSNTIAKYVEKCEELGVLRDINLLSLIRKSFRDQAFVESEFISAQKLMEILERDLGCSFTLDEKYEYRSISPGGIQIIVKDTNLTMRTGICETCPMYCQEGFYTIRVATDGTIMTCGDYSANTCPVPIVNAQKSIKENSLLEDLKTMIGILRESTLEKTLKKFFTFHGINIQLD